MTDRAPAPTPLGNDRIYMESVRVSWYRHMWRRAQVVEELVLADLDPLSTEPSVAITHATGRFVEHSVISARDHAIAERRVPSLLSMRIDAQCGAAVEMVLSRTSLGRTSGTITCTSPREREALGLAELLRRRLKNEMRIRTDGDHRVRRRVLLSLAITFTLSYLASVAAKWPG